MGVHACTSQLGESMQVTLQCATLKGHGDTLSVEIDRTSSEAVLTTTRMIVYLFDHYYYLAKTARSLLLNSGQADPKSMNAYTVAMPHGIQSS